MVKVDRLCNRVKPFAVLLWAFGIVLYLPTSDPCMPAGPASLHRRTGSMSLYGHAACVESWLYCYLSTYLWTAVIID